MTKCTAPNRGFWHNGCSTPAKKAVRKWTFVARWTAVEAAATPSRSEVVGNAWATHQTVQQDKVKIIEV